MDMWQKFIYILGVGMAVTIFVLFLHSYLPHMIENNDWERIQKTMITVDFMKKELESHSAYKAFQERYPNATIEFNKSGNNGGADYQLAMGNFTSNNSLILNMNYRVHDGRINVDISCDKFDTNLRGTSIHGALVTQYIKENTCMEIGITGPAVERGIINYDESPIIPE